PPRTSVAKMIWPYFFAVASSLAVTWVSLKVTEHMIRTPLSLLYVAVFCSALVGNARTGLLSCAITAWGAWRLVLPAAAQGQPAKAEWISFGVYVAFSVITV